MDLFPISGSVFTFLGLLGASVRALEQLKDGPSNLQRLDSELNQLCTITDEVVDHLRLHAVHDRESSVIQSVQSISEQLHSAQIFFREKLSKRRVANDPESSFRRRTWIVRKREITKLAKAVADARGDLQLAMQTLTWFSLTDLTGRNIGDAQAMKFQLDSVPDPSNPVHTACAADSSSLATFRFDRQIVDIDSAEVIREPDETSTTIDEFFDAVSRFSDATAETLQMLTTASEALPCWTFERSRSFFPEAYMLAHPLPYPLSICFHTEELCRTATYRVDRYCLWLASDARHWKRIIATIKIPDAINLSAVQNFVTQSDIRFSRVAPDFMRPILKALLQRDAFPNTLSRVAIDLEYKVQNCKGSSRSLYPVIKGLRAAGIASTLEYIRAFELEDLKQYLESELVVLSRENNVFLVLVEGDVFIERKVPFLQGAKLDEEIVADFISSLRSFKHGQGCSGVAKLAGIVLSDDRTQLLSYLVEAPRQGPLLSLMRRANAAHSPICWSRRQKWIYQMLQAIVELHKRQIVVGFSFFSIHEIWVDSNDDLKLVVFETVSVSWLDMLGQMPPEMRQTHEKEKSPHYCVKTPAQTTDLFQLGLLIWGLAQHVTDNSAIQFFHKTDCSTKLRYRCTEDHSNPIQLPPVVGDHVPGDFDVVIAHCRQENPANRKPASELLALMPQRAAIDYDTDPGQQGFIDILEDFHRTPLALYCDNCGELTNDLRYHCMRCHSGDFDLCPRCIEEGVICWDNTHKLDRIVLRNGDYVNESSLL